jgi:hypothetical protein
VVVHLQSLYRCAPAGRKPEEAHSVCTPGPFLSVVPMDVALYDRGEYALYRQAKAEAMAL